MLTFTNENKKIFNYSQWGVLLHIMRNKFEDFVEVPGGVECSYQDDFFECKKSGKELKKKIVLPGTSVKIDKEKILFKSEKANKKDIKVIKSCIAHLKNLFLGLERDFVYKLEICHVHFPMTLKLEGDKMVISNFLGEKTNRAAKIEKDVKVDIKGKDVLVSGMNLEKVGQTAANIEKATRVKNKDRRVFQDGIFIVEKKGGAEE